MKSQDPFKYYHVRTIHGFGLLIPAVRHKIVNWNFYLLAVTQALQSFHKQRKIECVWMVEIVFIGGCFDVLLFIQDLKMQ